MHNKKTDMINARVNIFIAGLSLFWFLYVIWSQVELRENRKALLEANARVYQVANYFEFLKEVYVSNDGVLNSEFIQKKNFDVVVTKAMARPSLSEQYKGELLYTVNYTPFVGEKKPEFKKYRSKEALGSEFYLLADDVGQIKELLWEKP